MWPVAGPVLRYIYACSRLHPSPPTLREIAKETGSAKSSVKEALRQLAAAGYVDIEPATSRTRRLTPSGLLAAQGYKLLYTDNP